MEKMFATAYGECIAFSIENGEQSMEAEVINLFCGVGGLTRGLSNAGFNVIAGFDNDATGVRIKTWTP